MQRGLEGRRIGVIASAAHEAVERGEAATADVGAFAARVVHEFSDLLEEHQLDEMSDMSFPASDPPATSPAAIGPRNPDRDGGARP